MTSDAQIKAFIDRILRLKEEQDTIGEDIRDIYAEAKAMGFDKTAMGNVVAHLRKVAKKGHDTVAEQGAIFDLYLSSYEGNGSHAPAPARTRENIEKFDRETGEILGDTVDAKLVETIAAGVQTEIGRKALIAAVDIMIQREEAEERRSDGGLNIVTKHTEIATASQGEAAAPSADRVSPIDVSGSAGANAGGEDVDRSAERATAARNEADATVTPASAFTPKPRSALRPNCRNPEACAGYGDRHCHACTVAVRQRAEEVA
ncbi:MULTISPECIES: GapR family DNA-binding domain-containing protein [Sinorhizobium]|uniref:DUF2312 domain-containing protein n=1 Tax=Sinorhizobium TaxID=28105 RepID=UPI000BE8A3FB|nr:MULTISPECIES: GapR family DNA-binding domain-containing protein [Sinorhizobium]PDT55064.1 hypothetical protein CO664_08330 [Sinorhizobium sp. NG07B]POH32106.1 hypothetical protein ATY30_11950 [Sinorhizobium americanum]